MSEITIPAAAALLLLSVGAGLNMGRATVLEIDPRIASAEESPTRTARPQRPLPVAAADPCVSCATFPEEYHPVRDPELQSQLDGAPPPAEGDGGEVAESAAPIEPASALLPEQPDGASGAPEPEPLPAPDFSAAAAAPATAL